MNYKITFSKQALKDRKPLYKSNLSKVAIDLLERISIDPFCYPPAFEKLNLKYKMYSRRINRQHRLVYVVNEDKREIYVIRMWTHYEGVIFKTK